MVYGVPYVISSANRVYVINVGTYSLSCHNFDFHRVIKGERIKKNTHTNPGEKILNYEMARNERFSATFMRSLIAEITLQ